MNVNSRYINQGYEAFPYTVDSSQGMAIEELTSHLSKVNGPFRRVVSYLGPDGQLHVAVGHVEPFDIDHVLARIAVSPSLESGVATNVHGGGKGYGLPDMYLSSVGEAAERILATMRYFAHENDYRFGTARDLEKDGCRFVGPEELHIFAPDQRSMFAPGGQFEPYSIDSPLCWISGRRLVSDEVVLAPAQMVELWYRFRPGEVAIGYSQSGGLSCHVSREAAVYHAITELIERDQLNLRWYSAIPPVRVQLDVDLGNDLNGDSLASDLSRSPIEPEIYYHNLDLHAVPVFTVIRFDEYFGQFSYLAGGGADTDASAALVKAMTEFGQSERMLRMAVLSPDKPLGQAVGRMFAVRHDASLAEFDVFFKVMGFYGNSRNRDKLNWYRSGPERALFSDLRNSASHPEGVAPETKLNRLKDVLTKVGIDPIIFDFTPPDWKYLRLMKVMIPQLTMAFLPSKPMLGHPRFANARRIAGVSDETVTFSELIRDPLPYP